MRVETVVEICGPRVARRLREFDDLGTFADRYVELIGHIQDLAMLRRICSEFVEDQTNSGVVAVDVALAPQMFDRRVGSTAVVLDTCLRELSAAGARLGVRVGSVVTALRTDKPAVAAGLAELAAQRVGSGVSAFGIAGVEEFPLAPLARAAEIASAAGLPLSVHAGESCGPESVAAAIEFGADRLEHGIRSIEDPGVVRAIAEQQLVCNLAVHSNVALGVYATVGAHPARLLIDAGVPITLNEDDAFFFGASIVDEYYAAGTSLGFSRDEITDVAGTGLQLAGAPMQGGRGESLKGEES